MNFSVQRFYKTHSSYSLNLLYPPLSNISGTRRCPSHLLFDAARAAHPGLSSEDTLFFHPRRSKNHPSLVSRSPRAHTLGKVGSRSRTAGFASSPANGFQRALTKCHDDAPRRSINLQVQATTTLCGRHSCSTRLFRK